MSITTTDRDTTRHAVRLEAHRLRNQALDAAPGAHRDRLMAMAEATEGAVDSVLDGDGTQQQVRDVTVSLALAHEPGWAEREAALTTLDAMYPHHWTN